MPSINRVNRAKDRVIFFIGCMGVNKQVKLSIIILQDSYTVNYRIEYNAERVRAW